MKKIVSLNTTGNNDAGNAVGDVVIPRVVVEEMISASREAVKNIARSRQLRTQLERHGYCLQFVEENYDCELKANMAMLRLTELVINHLWAK